MAIHVYLELSQLNVWIMMLTSFSHRYYCYRIFRSWQRIESQKNHTMQPYREIDTEEAV